MANLTADRRSIRKDGTLFSYPVACGKIIYAGALVNLDSRGYAVPASNDPSHTFAGKADAPADNRDGDDAIVRVEGHREGVFEFDCIGLDQSHVGHDAFIVDDHTVGLRIGKENDTYAIDWRHVYAGRIVEVCSATSVFIDILPAVRGRVGV